MGKWAKLLFGREAFQDVGIIVGGNNPEEMQVESLRKRFDVVESQTDKAFHAHLVEGSNGFYPVVFNVYGAAAAIDVLAQMRDGGCRNVLFLGYAYGFGDLRVGDIVAPHEAYHFDGVYQALGRDIGMRTRPDKELRLKLIQTLDSEGIEFHRGKHVSVPAVSLQPSHSNLRYERIHPATLEMELASVYTRSREIGMRSAGVLVVSDTRNDNLGSEENIKIRRETKLGVLDVLLNNLERFSLQPYLENGFSVDEHLASIVDMPGEEGNAYRE